MGMVKVRVPTAMRPLTDGTPEVSIEGATVRDVIDGLESGYPGFRERLLSEEGTQRRFVNIYVDEDDVRFREGLDTPTPSGVTLWLVPAVAGGSWEWGMP